MSPPTFSELGKNARSIFNSNYMFGSVKLSAKTTTAAPSIDLKTAMNGNIGTGKINGSLEAKYRNEEYGFTISEKWNTENVISFQLEADEPLPGLDLSLNTSVAVLSGKKSGSISSEFRHDYFTLDCDIDLSLAGPSIEGGAVLGSGGLYIGGELGFDSSDSTMTKSNFAFCYSSKDFSFSTNVNDGQSFSSSVHHKISNKIDGAVAFGMQTETGSTTFALGGRYKFDDASISAKINNLGHLGFGYSQQLFEGVKLTLSSLIDTSDLNAGGHKIGLGLDLDF